MCDSLALRGFFVYLELGVSGNFCTTLTLGNVARKFSKLLSGEFLTPTAKEGTPLKKDLTLSGS
jgi:hypothetical protein